MLSDLHEEILDDVRDAFGNFLRKHPQYSPHKKEFWKNPGLLIEQSVFNVVYPEARGLAIRADAYIDLVDGFGPMTVEVGRMDDGKWGGITASDQKPIRVMRIGFDRSVWILNPRHTAIEDAMGSFFSAALPLVEE